MNIYSTSAVTGFPAPCGRSGGQPPLGPPRNAGPEGTRRVPRPGAQSRLIVEVARLYHETRLTQAEIAARLRLTQGTVCRLLQKAAERGIVRVTVVPPEGTFVDLEELLERKFGLAQAVVAQAANGSEESVASALGAAAAHFLETTLRPREVVGVDAGSAALWSTVERMRPVWKAADCKVVQLVGAAGGPSVEARAHQLLTQLAGLVQGDAYFLPTPVLVESRKRPTSLPRTRTCARRWRCSTG